MLSTALAITRGDHEGAANMRHRSGLNLVGLSDREP